MTRSAARIRFAADATRTPHRLALPLASVAFAALAGACVPPPPPRALAPRRPSAETSMDARRPAAAAGMAARALVAGRDPDRLPSWGLDRIDQRGRRLDGRFVADATGAGVTIYIVDSGVRATHREFAPARASVGADFVTDGAGRGDCNGHGTAVAALAAGATTGVASGARVVALRVADCAGTIDDRALLAALAWLAEAGRVRRPAVVNLSLAVDPTVANPAWLHAADSLLARIIASGVTVVAAAGNGSVDACAVWPSRVPDVITVSATDASDARLRTSDGGGGVGYGPCVDLFAPGDGLPTAWYSSDHARRALSGTSAATAFVAGAAALVLQRDPDDSPRSIAEALTRDATRDRVASAGTGSPNRLLHVASQSRP